MEKKNDYLTVNRAGQVVVASYNDSEDKGYYECPGGFQQCYDSNTGEPLPSPNLGYLETGVYPRYKSIYELTRSI
jgi:hypothetical protein